MHLSRRQFLATSGVSLTALGGCTGTTNDEPAKTPAETPTPSRTETPSSSETPPQTTIATPTPTGLDGEITVKGSEWTLEPDAFETKIGQELTLHFENIGEVAHNLTVGQFPASERSVAEQDEEGTFMIKTDTIQSDETTSVTFTPDSTGTFPYWCDVPGHREAGMVGEMTTTK